MKKKLIKIALLFLFLIVFFSASLLIFDLSKYDSSYINRNALTFNINNINSNKAKKFFIFYNDLKHAVGSKFIASYQNHWSLEDENLRKQLPKNKVILAKKDNFIIGTSIEDVEINLSNWLRSHGGYTAKRFSNLDLINKSNIKKLDLAWVYNSKDGKKGIQANPVVLDGLVYLPTPGNNIVSLDGVTGKEVWKYKVKKGYHAAKRGMLIWKDKKKK